MSSATCPILERLAVTRLPAEGSGYTKENRDGSCSLARLVARAAPWAGIAIGCVGCIIITASSVYTALKMGSLPWPTIFTSITALGLLLRATGRTSLNEANITQVIMSAG